MYIIIYLNNKFLYNNLNNNLNNNLYNYFSYK